ncbi:MAG: hypothetical protein LW834_16635 [Cyanobium sp. 49614_E6]|nr:hypothetical protein [Cyanobium sp. 49614_E6]
MTALVKHESAVEGWLSSLPERKRSAALQYAAVSRWKKLDHRAILETEIMALHDDISEIRRAVEEGKIRLGDAPTKISYLSKELRGHIEHLSREVNAHDRRSMLLAGVEITSKMLRKVFGRDTNVWPAIEATVESVFAEIEAKHQS